ncbi:MAG: undecaprenyl-diphosphate phosphatase [Clostridia bacterium]|nr:undecaprenyl-diphosphate phosphatase [Clostridia bacterium]
MIIIEMLKSAVIGIVQGITEWLPVSSTGHMILAEKLLQLQVSADFWNMFKVVIQFSSILAVVMIYFHKLNPFSPKKSIEEKKETYSLWGKVLVAVLPAAVAGLFLDDLIDNVLSGSLVIATTLIVYGIAFLWIENRKAQPKIETLANLSYQTAFSIGLFQVLALIPGTPRSGSTILGALILGCSRFVGTEFSFFMAVPVMLGASGLKLLKFLLKGAALTSIEWAVMITGFVVTFFVSVWAIKFLIGYIKKHDFKAFGVYRIILGFVVIAAVLAGFLPM